MRESTLTKWSGCCLLFVFLLSCGSKKQVVSSESNPAAMSKMGKMALMRHVAQQQLHYTTFSGRAKSSLTINEKQSYDVTANVRIVHDEAIWVSVTALMGFEVARVFITPDSVKVINRLRSEYIAKPFAYLRDFAGSGLDFLSLERLLVGDVVDQVMGANVDVRQEAGGYLLQRDTEGLQYAVRLDTDYRNYRTAISAPLHDHRLEAFYSDFQAIDGNTFPIQMEISIATPYFILQSDMKYSKVVYDEQVELPFKVPSRYIEIQ